MGGTNITYGELPETADLNLTTVQNVDCPAEQQTWTPKASLLGDQREVGALRRRGLRKATSQMHAGNWLGAWILRNIIKVQFGEFEQGQDFECY